MAPRTRAARSAHLGKENDDLAPPSSLASSLVGGGRDSLPTAQTLAPPPAAMAPRTRSARLGKENDDLAPPSSLASSLVGGGRDSLPTAQTLAPPPAGRDDVEALLNQQIGGKSEELTEYTNKLRACIKWLLDKDDLAKSETLKQHADQVKEMELTDMINTITSLEEDCSAQIEMIEALRIQSQKAMQAMSDYENQKRLLEDLQLRLMEAEQKIVDGEKLRKKQHNTILELKGNIRVFCRVRPLISKESVAAVSYPKSGENVGCGVELMHKTKAYSYAFDNVFDHSASQEDVFTEISQLVQSSLDGYKVCIFAYGQTGSGKTHTMMGNPEVHDQRGLIPRSLEQIFQTSQCLISQGWKYKMQASMLEIYNETIHDLLATNRASVQDGAASKYNIRHDANGNTQVSDLTVIDVSSINEVSSLLKRAAQSRSVAKTQMNEESSRSHCVFTLRIFGVNERTDEQVQGVLNLIDLAGSERLTKSAVIGDRLKETKAINKSLSCLSEVILSIAKKDDHIPFRNSKLTYLLQPCLGGDSKTLMFVNLSPEASHTEESICSLRFAASVNSCEIGIPRRQAQTCSLSQG